ncbi:unnamed protein product [Candidula unifasciata]|uniref:Uncharacterized protein n=1 Tax=Candidula unifasciata TaxID=100452 RepID=A0A8S3Z5H6_9EUPU|nr:unnamed protein product [Candidula unifasciata]
MENFPYVSVLVFLGVAGQYPHYPPQNDCPYKECFCVGNEMLCNYRYMKAVPQKRNNTSLNMGSIDFGGNLITTIPARSLPANLSKLSLESNPIETIDITAFDESINTLSSLSLSGARFTQLPEAIFRLKHLTELDLYGINILTWNDTGMRGLGTTLQTLNLGAVGLTSWPGWLKSFSHLTELSVTSSSISILPDDALDMVATILTELSLTNNSLTSVPKTLSKMTVLTSLSLDQNRIKDITWLPQLCNLTHLTLNGNHISKAKKLSSALRFYADTIYYFQINDNFLASIPDMSFLKLITSLDYTNNHISDPYSGVIPSDLTDLQLSNNLLPSIPRIFKTMNSVPNLILGFNRVLSVQASDFPIATLTVDLEHNIIVELTDSSFPENSNIISLILRFNPISKISKSAFDNLPRLQQLDIQHTKLTRLPLAIESLTQLSSIDVSGSTDLVCTCLEKSLERIISQLSSYSVAGDCGQTSLYIFFTELSPSCPPM